MKYFFVKLVQYNVYLIGTVVTNGLHDIGLFY